MLLKYFHSLVTYFHSLVKFIHNILQIWNPVSFPVYFMLVHVICVVISTVTYKIFQGFDVADGGGILLISDVIREMLKIPCAALMGANIANEVAKENYCEATIGNFQIPKLLF